MSASLCGDLSHPPLPAPLHLAHRRSVRTCSDTHALREAPRRRERKTRERLGQAWHHAARRAARHAHRGSFPALFNGRRGAMAYAAPEQSARRPPADPQGHRAPAVPRWEKEVPSSLSCMRTGHPSGQGLPSEERGSSSFCLSQMWADALDFLVYCIGGCCCDYTSYICLAIIS